MVALRVNVPWFNRGKYRAAMSRDQQKLEAARKDLENAQLALKEEVHLLTIRIESARREARLYQSDIIPRSESALASARSAWEAGSGMFRDVLEARRMLVDARLMQSRAVAEQYEMLSELVLCCGLGDLEALQMLAEGKEPERKTNEK
jgi:outer membrane protein TolC